MLLYIARVYEHIIPNKEVHKEHLLKVVRPFPVVFYTGRDRGKSAMEQDRVTLCLSDAFKGEPNPFGNLELEVLVLNITPGHNEELLQRSPLLRGYMDFITHLREQEQTMPRMEAIVSTVDWCIAHDILANFFRQHRMEVSNMILNELSNADAIEAAKEETWEKASKAAWQEASKVVSEATWQVAQQHWEAAQQRILALVQQGLSGAQLEQAIKNEHPGLVPQSTQTASST
jgi:hypothetical protein